MKRVGFRSVRARVFFTIIPIMTVAMIILSFLSNRFEDSLPMQGTIIVLSVLLVSVSLVLVSRYITKNLGEVNRLSEALAEGDFSRQMQVTARDEFGRMADALNRTVKTLRATVGTVAESSEQVAATAEELTASAQQTSEAAEQIAQSIVEVASGTQAQMAIAN